MDQVSEEYYMDRSPDFLLATIDLNYYQAKKLKLSRLDVRWGKWSAAMNRAIRKMDDGGPQALRYKYVFIYWTIISQLLESHHKGGLVQLGKKKRLKKESLEVRRMVLTGKGLKEFDASAKNILNLLTGKK